MFKFSLQRVLELRAKREQEAGAALASARDQADQARREYEELEQVRTHGMLSAAAARCGGVTVGQLRNFGVVLEAMDEQIASARVEAHKADAEVERRLTDLTSASQDRQVLARLRQKHLQGWQTEEVQEDRKLMDSIALTRHVRIQASLNEEAE
jgi:flagellar export protein FliJ